MYNLLVVDDEPIITDSLHKLVIRNKEKLKDIFIHKAYSGAEALQIINARRIDILLTDVCMPQIDGFHLQKLMNKRWPECRVIFLSGYNDFRYVQQALKTGSADYILKTDDDEEIIASIQKSIDKIKDEEVKVKHTLEMRKQYELLEDNAVKKTFFKIIQGKSIFYTDEKDHLKCLEIPLNHNIPLLILGITLKTAEIQMSDEKIISLFTRIKNIVNSYLPEQTRKFVFLYDFNIQIWLIQPCDTEKDSEESGKCVGNNRTKELYNSLRRIKQICNQSFSGEAKLSMCEDYIYWDEIEQEIEKLNMEKGKLESKKFVGNDIEWVEGKTELPVVLNEKMKGALKWLDEIVIHMTAGDFDMALSIFLEVNKSIKSNIDIPFYIKVQVYFSISSFLINCINDWDLTDTMEYFPQKTNLPELMENCTWGEVCDKQVDIFRQCIELRKLSHTDRYLKIVNRINQYVLLNINMSLSLEILSELVNLSPAYLSKLYKTITNKNLSDYIDEARLKKAKELLMDEAYRIKEIAYATGFHTASSFNKFIKKHLGVSPQAFRNHCIN